MLTRCDFAECKSPTGTVACHQKIHNRVGKPQTLLMMVRPRTAIGRWCSNLTCSIFIIFRKRGCKPQTNREPFPISPPLSLHDLQPDSPKQRRDGIPRADNDKQVPSKRIEGKVTHLTHLYTLKSFQLRVLPICAITNVLI
jgi:hypothetical protein